MRPAVLNPLFTPVTAYRGIGPRIGRLIENLCGPFISDVLWHLPIGVNPRPRYTEAATVRPNTLGTLPITVGWHSAPKNKRYPYHIGGISLDRNLDLVFFNYHASYLRQKFPEGKTVWVSGKIEPDGLGFKILHPDYIADTPDTIPTFEVIYPQSRGVTSKLLRRLIESQLPRLPDLPEWLDPAFQSKYHLPAWRDAVTFAHSPRTESDLLATHPARFRLAYDEVLANQLALLLVRAQSKRQSGRAVCGTGRLTEGLLSTLPFQLTGAQQRVFSEIQNDLAAPERMTRLLQGDVGSGKTVVALLAMLTTVEAGFQATLMAPTDILARQHFDKIARLCAPLGVQVGLLTGRDKGRTRAQILDDLTAGRIQILIGTHALFTESVSYHNLGLVVIDEQHKFGVRQRLSLVRKDQGVNLLVMTATPIPRSLALTVYGDMDVSRLDEKPAGRQPIETNVLPMSRIPELIKRLHARIAGTAHTQAYWICPLVDASETTDLSAVKARFADLKKTFGDRVGLVHGKMKGPDKDAVMARFAAGELDVLVATTVIEVGVDVKSATIMIIEQAERFGLAGLHQLRGRVGRGSDRSQCLLLHGPRLTETARRRLNILRETDDGFTLAEEDLKLRGAGEMIGTRQRGLPTFRIADPSLQNDLIWTATRDAQTILSLDPRLTSPRGQALRLLLYLFQKDTELQTLKAG